MRPALLSLALLPLLHTPASSAESRPELSKQIEQVMPKVISWRRDIHQHPELSNREVRTAAKVASHLEKLGLEVRTGIAHTGVVGILTGAKAGPVVALRADMDALPVTEQTGLPFASKVVNEFNGQQTGVMHACGHDGHTAMLLGAAERLATERNFDGTVVFLFQPDEEHGSGARRMIEEGVLERFPIDEVYAIHNLPGAPLGQVSTRTGQICASESLFEIIVSGKGGHASMPHVGVDALTVGAEMVLALQTVVSRKLAPGAGAVVSVTPWAVLTFLAAMPLTILVALMMFWTIPAAGALACLFRHRDPAGQCDHRREDQGSAGCVLVSKHSCMSFR